MPPTAPQPPRNAPPASIAFLRDCCHQDATPTDLPMSCPPFGDVIAVWNAPFLKVFTIYVLSRAFFFAR